VSTEDPLPPRTLGDPSADHLPAEAPTVVHPDLAEKIRTIPELPGVYLMRDGRRRVLYVGKSASLRSRVRSYFQSGGDLSARIRWMVSRVADVETIVVDSEMEALLLENNLIKRHRPYFNVKFRDDKRYPMLEVSTGEEYPRLRVVRRPHSPKHRYFGPFPDTGALRRTRKVLQRVFQIRTCNLDMSKEAPRPCLDYYIHRCTAPCARLVSAEDYRKAVDGALEFLEGQTSKLLDRLRREMAEEIQALNFERCARLRDMLTDLERLVEQQHVVLDTPEDEDYVALTSGKGLACAVVLQVREGKLLGQRDFLLDAHLQAGVPHEVGAFLQQHYSEGSPPPRRILVTRLPEEAELLSRWLGQRRGGRVEIRQPRRGEKRRLLAMALKNARQRLHQELAVPSRVDLRAEGLEELRRALNLSHSPWRLECVDISNFHGKQAVGSLVVFEHGLPRRSHYRRFRIRGAQTPDDFRMMGEVLRRRFAAALEPDSAESERRFPTLPDLLVVDGGKGQLGVAVQVLTELGLIERVPVVGLAKQHEELFLPGIPDPVVLAEDCKARLLITHLRDEAHRFAITYHRELRGRTVRRSTLDEVPGIGPARKKALLRHFGSVDRLMSAHPEDLARVEGIGPGLAAILHRHLHGAPHDLGED